MQSKRDNTFETATIYLKKYIDHNLQGDDQTSANLVVNETAAAFCMFRVVFRDINIGLLVKTGQVKRTKTMEGEQEAPAQSPPVYVPAPPLRRGSPAPAKKKRKVTKQKGGDNPG